MISFFKKFQYEVLSTNQLTVLSHGERDSEHAKVIMLFKQNGFGKRKIEYIVFWKNEIHAASINRWLSL